MYTIGSDPEFLVIKNREPYPAFNIVKGTKKKPTDLGDGYKVLYDNVLVEGNIPPAKSGEEFITNIRTLKDKINRVLMPFDCDLLEEDSGIYLPKHLIDKRAQEIGCMPYMNAWTFQEEVPGDFTGSMRPAGFHIHVGYENTTEYPNELVNIAIARVFDYFVVLPAKYYHHDSLRWSTYGGFGKFRHTPYGIELRSLGASFSRDKCLKWVYDQTIKALDFVFQSNSINVFLDLEIDSLTMEGARDILGISLMEQRVHTSIFKEELLKIALT